MRLYQRVRDNSKRRILRRIFLRNVAEFLRTR